MVGVLKSSLEVTNAYYFTGKKKNYHFAQEAAREIRNVHGSTAIKKKPKARGKR